MESHIENKIKTRLEAGFKIYINEIFSKSTEIFKGIAGYAILALIVYYILNGVINYFLGFIFPGSALNYTEIMESIQSGDNDELIETLTEYSENSSSISSIISSIVSFALYPILFSIYTMAYKFDHYKNVEFSDLFVHYKDGKFVRIFLVSVIIYVVSMIGLVFCIIPGIIVYTMWMLVIPLVIFADAKVSEALTYSMKLAFKDFGSFLLFLLAIFGVIIIGILLCCVGLIGAIPFTFVLTYVLYKEVVGFTNDNNEIEEIGTDIYKDNPYMN